MKVQCEIHFEDRVKPVPYPREIRSDSINFGFQNLKSSPDLATEVAEAKDLPGLIALLKVLSKEESPYFSIACEKATWPEGAGLYSTRGYVEFSLNYLTTAHFQNYMSIFAEFETFAQKCRIEGLDSFVWIVSPVSIIHLGATVHSCTIWTTIRKRSSESLALRDYDRAMFVLKRFFQKILVPHGSGKPIF